MKTNYILGVNCTYHESSACILKDGNLIAYSEEERINRIKHAKPSLIDNADELPVGSIEYCLEKAGINYKDINYITCNFDPKDRLEHAVGMDSGHKIHENSWGTEEGEKMFFEVNLNIIKKLSDLFERDISGIFNSVKHHYAHAAGAYYSSGFNSSAILVIDGIAEHNSTWLGIGKGTDIKNYYEIDYPNSIGFLWEKMSEFLGFSEYDAEKVMGLASYGNYENELNSMKELVYITEEGQFKVNNDILLFRTGDFSGLEKNFCVSSRKKGEELTSKHQDIAAAMQHMTEQIIISLAKKLKELSGEENLCLAGGTAFNVVSNTKLIQENIFKNVYIQPEANDAGGSIGSAFYFYANVLKLGKPKSVDHAYLGPKYSNEYILSVLNKNPELNFEFIEDIGKKTAKLLTEGNLIGWFQGEMEAGPRALGHRSLIGDPRRTDIMDLINKKVKLREYFRPVAPSVLKEYVFDWFNLPNPIPNPAYYMLMAIKAKEEKKSLIPAVVHVDGTSRIQVVDNSVSPEYWNLINEFYQLTGVPMILNTSLNIQEPIVRSPEDAIKTFLKSNIDYLVLENYLCKKSISKN